MKHLINIKFEDDSKPVFYPMEMVSGTVEFTIQKTIKIESLQLIVKGKTKVARPVGNVMYTGLEKHLNYSIPLIVCESSEPKEVTAGMHIFKFSCQLPENAPATLDKKGSCDGYGALGYIQYKVKVNLDVPYSRKISVEREFTVKREHDLNLIPALNKAANFQEILPLRNLCCTTKKVEIKLKLLKLGYALGEKIPFTIEVVGVEGKFPVKKVQIKLKRIKRFNCLKPSEKMIIDVKTEINTLLPFVLQGDFLHIKSSIEVPQTCPISNDKYGHLYHTFYKLDFSFLSDGCEKSVTISVLIEIGTIPINGEIE